MDYEVIVLGGGPAGYIAAIKAAQKGYSVVCISPELGGTCLQRGCIPSKLLLDVSKKWQFLSKLKTFGINVNDCSYDLKHIIKRKEQTISTLSKGIESSFKKHGVTWIKAKGKYINGSIMLSGSEKGYIDKENECTIHTQYAANQIINHTKALILATGSENINVSFDNPENVIVHDSEQALCWEQVPKSLLVVGAGYIGLELASVWARLGSKVTIIDLSDQFLPFIDEDVSSYLRKELEKLMDIKTNVTIKKILGKTGDDIKVQLTDGTIWEGEKILCAIGRKALTKDLLTTGLEIEKGVVAIDEYMQTNIKGIYAIGDITSGPMLAHKASDQAWIAIEHLYDNNPPNNSNKMKVCVPKMELVPSVMYVDPELATVGATEKMLEPGSYKTYKSTFSHNGRAIACGQTEGFIKVLVSNEEKIILGACVIGANAESIICQIAVAMSFGASANDLASVCYPHPSIDESLRDLMMEASVWCQNNID